MNEVSCRTCAPLVEAVRERGLSPSELVRGLPFSFEALEHASNRIGWDDFTLLIENSARVLGGIREIEHLAARYYTRSGGILGAMAMALGDVRPVYHMGARWYGPSLYSSTRATLENLPDGRIRQTIEILPGYRDSQFFFQMMRGALRTVPSLLGQPNARVELEIQPRKGIFTITPPPPLTYWERVRRVFAAPNVVADADEELAAYQDEIEHGYVLAREVSTQLKEEKNERARAEQLLQQAQKLDAMGRLAGGVAHNFNNVLTAITGYAELALDRIDPDHPVAADLGEIRAVAERAADLVNQILTFSRHQVCDPQRLELNSVILAMEPMLKRLIPSSVQLIILPAAEALPLLADPGQMEQIVANLMVNARDAMAGGGRITIETREVAEREVATGARLAGSPARFARLETRDTGCGMSRETLARAFEPFFTTKAHAKGTGLGLSTVYGIVTQSGGEIRLESELGKGTNVIIDLPLATGPAQAPEPGPPSGPAPGGSETILLVENERTVRTVARRTLEARGYTVLSASDASEARALAHQHAGPIALLVTDVVLPDTDGRELASQLDALRPELCGALLISGYALEEIGTAAAPLPNHVLLGKPFAPQALLNAVRRLLDG
jgi:signal transduction histidine kinase